MNNKGSISIVEVIVLGIVLILALLVFLSLSHSRNGKYGKRSVCLGNLKSLSLAWHLYSDANDDKIINGQAYDGIDGTNGSRNGEPYWVGDDVGTYNGTRLATSIQEQAIQAGALFPYINYMRGYQCPSGVRGELRTYSIVDSMNGTARTGTTIDGNSVTIDSTVLFIKNINEIKEPAKRIGFIDTGQAATGSFGAYYDTEKWLDTVVCRHNDKFSHNIVSTASFADGHAEVLKWTGKDTIKNGRLAQPQSQFAPTTKKGFKDLYKFQEAVWGRLGYTPSK